MVVDQSFERGAWFNGKKNPNLKGLQLSKKVFEHQNHAKMNIHILRNVMVVWRLNDQKVVNYVRAKA
jgi:hypothetical protein